MRPGPALFPFCYFLKESASHEYAIVSTPNSTRRRMPGGWADQASLPKGAEGRSLCRWCNIQVPKGRRTFCSDWCVEEWRLRSDPGYLRERVLERDRGICAGVAFSAARQCRSLPEGRRSSRCRQCHQQKDIPPHSQAP